MNNSNLQTSTIVDTLSEWMVDTINMAIEQGYRVTPLYPQGHLAKYADGQSYDATAIEWKGCVDGVVPVILDRAILLDDDGHKKEGAITQSNIEGEIGFSLEPYLMQENEERNSRHFLFKFPDDANLDHYSQANNGQAITGWDIKTRNQPVFIKQSKILIDEELPTLDELTVAPDYILDILKKDSSSNKRLYKASVGGTSPFFRYLEHKGFVYSHSTESGHRFFHPDATTKSAGTVLSLIDGVEKVKSFDSGKLNTKDDSHAHDLASVIEVLEGLSKSESFTKEAEVLKGNFDFNPSNVVSYSKDIVSLFDSVNERVCSVLGVEKLPVGTIKPSVIDKVMSGSAWYPQQSKYYLMNHDNYFIPVREKDAILFFARTFGQPVELSKIGQEIESAATANEVETDKIESRVKGVAWMVLFDELRYRKHMTAINYKVDMFIKRGQVKALNDGVYSVVMPHKELVGGYVDQAVIDDFKEHFPFFTDFLDLLVMARFAPDRKKAYLWLQATSDFGKGFLTGAMEHHGLVVNMTAKETEAIFEGKPSSRQASDFLRAWALVFNEFKTVKSELKELESSIQMSPKNQMMQRAQIFAKVFFSADGVASMTGEHGVETQFANRFSYKKLTGNIEERALFKEIGKGEYMRSIQNFIALYINGAVSHMRSLGTSTAEKTASDWIDQFHAANGIRNTFGDTADNIVDIAQDFKDWCLDTFRTDTQMMDMHQRKIYKHLLNEKEEHWNAGIMHHDCLLSKPKTVFDVWVDATYSRSEKGMITKMKDKVLDQIGNYGKYTAKGSKRVNAHLIKNE